LALPLPQRNESIVSGAGEAIDREAEVKEDTPTPTDEEKGKRRADIDAVAKFEERESEERDGLKQREVLGN
jgi:hypothetical protein